MSDSPYASKPWLKHYDFWVPAEINAPNQPLYQILQIASVCYKERPAMAFMGAEFDFGQMKSRVDRLATALARLGIGKSDRVGIMLPNCPQYPISFFAIVRLGAIVVNVNPLQLPANSDTRPRRSPDGRRGRRRWQRRWMPDDGAAGQFAGQRHRGMNSVLERETARLRQMTASEKVAVMRSLWRQAWSLKTAGVRSRCSFDRSSASEYRT